MVLLFLARVRIPHPLPEKKSCNLNGLQDFSLYINGFRRFERSILLFLKIHFWYEKHTFNSRFGHEIGHEIRTLCSDNTR